MHLTIQETPLHPINWSNNGNTFYIKRDDLIPFSFGGNKVRIANQFLLDMEQGGYDCMIAYGQSQSNLCRIVSNLCASLGMDCYVVSAVDPGSEYHETFNSRMVRSFGARILTCQKDKVSQTLQDLMDRLRNQGKHPYYVYGNIYGTGREAVAANAYKQAYSEIHAAMEKGVPFDYLFLASATGTTQAGLISGCRAYGDPLQIVGISAARSEEAGIAAIQKNLEALGDADAKDAIHFTDAYRAGGYGKYNDGIRQVIREMMQKNGVPLDPTYTGKAFWGMNQYLQEHEIHDKKILFLHTGGAPLFFDQLLP